MLILSKILIFFFDFISYSKSRHIRLRRRQYYYICFSTSKNHFTRYSKNVFAFFSFSYFFYFSVNFLAAVWVFLPGCNSAIVSKVFIVSSLLLISSSFVSASITAGGGLLYGFFLATFLYFSTIFLAATWVAPLDFFKSITSPTGSAPLLLFQCYYRHYFWHYFLEH